MNLYLIWQEANMGYDTYRSAVVAAKTVEQARAIHPDGTGKPLSLHHEEASGHTWVVKASDVKAKLIGKAAPSIEPGLILADYRAD